MEEDLCQHRRENSEQNKCGEKKNGSYPPGANNLMPDAAFYDLPKVAALGRRAPTRCGFPVCPQIIMGQRPFFQGPAVSLHP